MNLSHLPALVTQREEALILLQAIGEGVDERELAPFVSALTSPENEQALAIMRGSGNEMSVRVALGAMLAEAGLITEAEAFAALTPGRQRSYVIALSSAKTSATRTARVERFRARITAGKGATER